MRGARTSHVRALPPIMYGTAWKEDRTQALVLEAIATGFRAFDTANQRKHYVEEEVGAAVRTAIGSAGSISFLRPARDAAAHWHNRRRSHEAQPCHLGFYF